MPIRASSWTSAGFRCTAPINDTVATCRMGRVASFEFAKPSRCQQLVRTLSFAPLPDPGEQLYTHSLTPSSFGALTSWDRPVPTAACGALHELCGLALCRAGTIA